MHRINHTELIIAGITLGAGGADILRFREGGGADQTITVGAIVDDVDESSETLTIRFTEGDIPVTIANFELIFTIAANGTPTVMLEGAPASVSSTDPFEVRATFPYAVRGFVAGDLVLENATATVVPVSGSVYTLIVTPTGEGDVSIRLPAGAGVILDGDDDFNPRSNTVTVVFVKIAEMAFSDAQVVEGGSVDLVVTLDGPAPVGGFAFDLILDTSVTGVAASGADISSSSLSITIPAGDMAAAISI